MKTVLVAEDEVSIRDFIVINLQRSGYEVLEAGDGLEALHIYDERNGDIDVALLDIMMPQMDGLELCKQLRARSPLLGIIMLTARTQEMDKVTGLLVGADDYVTKPFSPSELMARVDAIYRRVEMSKASSDPKAQDDTITLGEFVLNPRNRTLTKRGNFIDLTQVEFQIIECFFQNPGAALDRTDILNRVWGSSYFGEEKIVDVNIRRLRMKIEDEPSNPKHLVTIWGLGYKWVV
ncbi:MAG: response regulator transcription factor [Candidatus Fimivicinus sp.]|nr:response regulator transcription factor [Oscillospiraceae bacterium]MDY5591133.1 response regulator transcription factor [Candidatus Fimivicinus sp.]